MIFAYAKVIIIVISIVFTFKKSNIVNSKSWRLNIFFRHIENLIYLEVDISIYNRQK